MILGDVELALQSIAALQARRRALRLREMAVALSLLDAAVGAKLTRMAHRRAEPNIFATLGIATREETISRMIAWLCNPRDTHGLGTSFLLDFLAAVGAQVATIDAREAIARQLHDAHTWSTQVTREVSRGNCRADVVIDGSACRLVIETKLNSVEHGDQTNRYVRMFRRGTHTVFVYLAPDGAPEPASNEFTVVRHSALFKLVGEMSRRYRLHETTDSLLRQFTNAISTWEES